MKTPRSDPDGPIDYDESLDLPDAIMDPLPPRVQQELNASGDHIQNLRGEIREAELETQKKRLVDTFNEEVNRAYGLRPDSIDYDQFRIDTDDKTLYWTPGDIKILITMTREGLQALGRALANLVGKAAAALPGIIGSIVSWLMRTLGKTSNGSHKICGPWPLLWGPYFSWLLGTG